MRKPVIQTVSVGDTVEIFGIAVKGLQAVCDAVECRSSVGSLGKGISKEPYISFIDPVKAIDGIHVLEVYERYPCFDSSDYATEDRYFRNFFFSTKPFTMGEIYRFALMNRKCNLQFIDENMPDWAIPSIYYDGDSKKMTLAI